MKGYHYLGALILSIAIGLNAWKIWDSEEVGWFALNVASLAFILADGMTEGLRSRKLDKKP